MDENLKLLRSDDSGSVYQIIRPEQRKCGECRLCCKLLAVGKAEYPDDFQKPQGEWCKHSCDIGCAIYATRPKDCAEYECTWFSGVFEEDDRPDKSKIVVSLEHGESVTDDTGKVVFGPTPVWCVYEWLPGITQHGRAKEIVEVLEHLIIEETPGNYRGPFPICIIPSKNLTRTVKFPGAKFWMPMLRPGEIDPRRDPPLKKKR